MNLAKGKGTHPSKDSPRLYVVGAGAMGCLFGGLLAEGGLDVTLVDPWREHVDAINGKGLRIVGFGGDRDIPVRAVACPAGLPVADMVFVQCKSYCTEVAIKSAIGAVGAETVVISFQNGLGNEELLASVVGEDQVLGGLTAQGASVEAPGTVRNYSELPTWIGEMSGGVSGRAAGLARILSEHGLPTSASENIRLDIWKKLMANVGVSAPSGIANLRIRHLMRVPHMRETAYAAISEAAEVARAIGIDLDPIEAREVLEKVSGPGGTGDNKSSLCIDLLHGRQTEIDFINGAIVQLGMRHGIPTPVNATLVSAVKALEFRNAELGGKE